MLQKIKSIAATNHSGAMEAENHVKHGASSKSLMSRGNFLNIFIRGFSFFIILLMVAACEDDLPETPTGVTATQEGNNIKIAWNPVNGARIIEFILVQMVCLFPLHMQHQIIIMCMKIQ